MTPKEFIDELVAGHNFYDFGAEVVDGPHVVSDQKVVMYLKADGGPRLRVEVTQT